MRVVTLISLLVITNQFVSAQNVGINKTNPTEALDVKGNINVESGTIKVNGSGGASGQVLTSNGANGLAWSSASSSSFKNQRVFSAGNTMQSFLVPAGVTSIYYEGWSGGGVAVFSTENIAYKWYGGGSGGYVKGYLAVTPGQLIKVRVPYGQNNPTSIDSLYIELDAANSLLLPNAKKEKGAEIPTRKGSFINNCFFVQGSDGEGLYYQSFYNSVGYMHHLYTFPGGADAPFGGKGGRGGIIGLRDNSVILQYTTGSNGKIPGGGAGADPDYSAPADATTKIAGAGLLVFYY